MIHRFQLGRIALDSNWVIKSVLTAILALCSGAIYGQGDSEEFDIESLFDKPWYVIRETNRLDDSGNAMAICKRPEFEPADLIKIAESREITYTIKEDEEPIGGHMAFVEITLDMPDGKIPILYLRGKEHSEFQARSRGYSVFDISDYR